MAETIELPSQRCRRSAASKTKQETAIASDIDYSLNRWTALMAYLVDGDIPIDNNHIENLMRPWAMGRKEWLFAGVNWLANAPPSS